ncbi:MAG: alpha/beta family hydrolase [Ginsengibacter sp.]
MKTQSCSLFISDAVGSVSGEYIIPQKSICIITIAHGAGAGMNHPFMTALANSLAEKNIVTLRFNFPFMENKKGRPDVPVVAHKTIEAAIAHAHKKFPSLPLFISGKSFGGRMSSQYLAIHADSVVKGIIFYGFPLHPPGKPSAERAEHLKDVKQPMLFLSGTRDEFATLGLLENVCSSLKDATLIKIEGANHGFKAGKQNTMEMLVNFTNDWIGKLIKN